MLVVAEETIDFGNAIDIECDPQISTLDDKERRSTSPNSPLSHLSRIHEIGRTRSFARVPSALSPRQKDQIELRKLSETFASLRSAARALLRVLFHLIHQFAANSPAINRRAKLGNRGGTALSRSCKGNVVVPSPW